MRVWLSITLAGFSTLASAADQGDYRALNGAPQVFVATIAAVRAGPVGLSNPPVRSYTLTLEDFDPLRGAKPALAAFGYQIRSQAEPVFDLGKRYVVAARPPSQKARQGTITLIIPATAQNLQLARQSVSVPLGWLIVDGKPVSPWASRNKAWPSGGKSGDVVCSKSARPALLAGAGVKLVVEQVPPLELQKFKNPYGDGQFKIIVTNTTKAPIQVPALIKDGGAVRWDESIVVMLKDEAHLLPRQKPLIDPQPLELAPGESASGIIDTLLLGDAVAWPRGGSRVYFTFCLGDVAADGFFYYYSKLHDEIRQQRLRELAQ